MKKTVVFLAYQGFSCFCGLIIGLALMFAWVKSDMRLVAESMPIFWFWWAVYGPKE